MYTYYYDRENTQYIIMLNGVQVHEGRILSEVRDYVNNMNYGV